MEYLEGPTLRKVLAADGPMLPVRAGRLAELLGSALGAIHSRGIVHRDLKPENIMVLDAGSAEERPVIIDFGTSAARGPEHDLEFTTSLTGSLAYLAPERLNRQYSPASDVFSLGVILLEMLTGKRPADFPVAPGNPEFVKILGTEIGVRPAALLVLAFEHQPLKRPDDVAGWTSELARALRITGDRPSI
jgi:serine/threonine-protein kinase